MTLDISAIRRQFPICAQNIGANPLVYLDSAATAQKPTAVLQAMQHFYEHDNANVHRGMHVLAERTTALYEDARKTVQKFINARYPEEIIFTKSCTESINLVAHGFFSSLSHGESLPAGRQGSGPERGPLGERGSVILSILEHHSNIVPWMTQKAHLHWIDIDNDGNLNMENLEKVLKTEKINIVAITGQSNVLGTRPPIKEIIQKAHAAGAKVLVDAAQLVAHAAIDVQELDCDFLAFSAHKLYGPTGIGVLYGKRALLENMPSLIGGGMMIKEVTQDGFTPADSPQKFEGGTPPIAEAIGLKAAIDWLSQFDWKDIEEYEGNLIQHVATLLKEIDGLSILGNVMVSPMCHGEPCRTTNHDISGCISFTIDGIHPHDLTDILGQQGICLRAGHHCTMPLHKRLGISASTRASFGIYNTTEEIDILAPAIKKAQRKLKI